MKTPTIEDFFYYDSNLEEAVGLCIDAEGLLIEIIPGTKQDTILQINGIFAEFINLGEEIGEGQIVVDYCLSLKN
tara:strand:+ start:12589 stop:12813 length:225 start_codon:yes stop_codon:yes gene_type:complete